MSDFRFPIKQGYVYHIDSLDYRNLQYGIYKCNIQCDHPDFRNLFTFATNGYYTHTDLLFAYKYKKKYGVTITLDVDSEYNSLLYEDSDLIDSKTIFNHWYVSLSRAKSLFPKNKAVKHLLSSVCGHLIRFNQIKTDDEDAYMNLDVSRMNNNLSTRYKQLSMECYANKSKLGYRTLYTYIDTRRPYKHNLARMKPFFMAYTRNFMAKLLISENLVDKFIRSHTDNITLSVPHDFSHLSYYPKSEDKTSGLITWSNANKYTKNVD
jgi:hypothetical protein